MAKGTQRRLAAIVAIDVAGYSRLMGADEPGTLARLKENRSATDPISRKHSGRIVGTAGDGLLLEFPSVVEAVISTIEVQALMAERNAGFPDDRKMLFRIGINLGDVMIDGDEIYGEGVNIAARLESLSEPGGVCISRSVYEQVRNKLDLGFEYVGAQTLKNIADKVEVYRLLQSAGPAAMIACPRPALQADAPDMDILSEPSVVVLPFQNMSGDGAQDFFADGITEDIITNLTRFRGLLSIARASAFVFKSSDKPVQQIARQLGARYVVQGGVQRAGKRVRINIHLFEGESGRNLWSERYDRDLDDIFEIQEDITNMAVGAMAVQIEAAESARSKTLSPNNLQSYGLVLQGQNRIYRFRRHDIEAAQGFYQQALDNSPKYARALAGISRTHNLNWFFSWSEDPKDSLNSAYELAEQAVENDPNDARGLAQLGFVQLYRREHDASLAAYRRAEHLNPNDADTLAEMADAMTHSGYSEESLDYFRKAMRLNPCYPDLYLWTMAGAHLKLHQHQEAIDCILRMHNAAQGRRVLAASYAHLGRLDEARQEASMIRELQPEFSVDAWAEIIPDKRPEDIEHFLSGLRMAGL